MKFNVPTKLTFLRIILTLVIVFLLLFPFHLIGINFPTILFRNVLLDLRYILAGIIFIFASVTDYFDGMLARKNNEVTDFGKFVDAIADKMLVNSVLVIFAATGYISAIIPTIIVIRDIVVDAIRMNVAGKGKVQAAKFAGKLKTASLMVGITLTFFYNLPFELWKLDISKAFLYFGTIMSLVSMVEYYNLNKKYLFQEFKKTQK